MSFKVFSSLNDVFAAVERGEYNAPNGAEVAAVFEFYVGESAHRDELADMIVFDDGLYLINVYQHPHTEAVGVDEMAVEADETNNLLLLWCVHG